MNNTEIIQVYQADEVVPVVFHFNKAHNANPDIPPWIVKVKGQTYYVHHMDTNGVPFSTKETPDSEHTKGALKFKGKIKIFGQNDQIFAEMY